MGGFLEKNSKTIGNKIEIIREIKSFKGNEGYPINILLLLRDGRLAIGSYHNINIFNTSNFQCELEKNAHIGDVLSLCEVGSNKLISCSSDKTIKIWTITNNSLQHEKTITDHTLNVNKVILLTNNRFASCSSDKLINIYNNKYPYDFIISLEGNFWDFKSIIQLKGKETLISCGDRSIIFWNLINYQKETILEEKEKGINWYNVQSLFEYKDNLIVGGKKLILIIDINKRILLKEIKDANFFVAKSFIALNSNSILIGDQRGGLYDLNLTNYEYHLVKNNADNSIISMVRIDEKRFATSSAYGTIKIFEL